MYYSLLNDLLKSLHHQSLLYILLKNYSGKNCITKFSLQRDKNEKGEIGRIYTHSDFHIPMYTLTISTFIFVTLFFDHWYLVVLVKVIIYKLRLYR